MTILQKLSVPLIAALLLLSAALALPACSQSPRSFEAQREAMVERQLVGRGITDPAVLGAFRLVPREQFVLPEHRQRAYDDLEAPVGFGQSLDRAWENATMLSALALTPADNVLEVGTGVGYLASLMSRIAAHVSTIEIEPAIADAARANIAALGYPNVEVKTGDGFLGWPERAPFDAIVLTCSPDEVPAPLAAQLAEGGRLLLPLGGTEKFQELVLFTKENGKLVEARRLAPAEFVPMKGLIRKK